jgi:hypothetical protein
MPKRITITLTEAERRKLERIRDRHGRFYLRERASAILKIADGMSPYQVALRGLLKKRDPDTVYSWVRRYQAEGIQGLVIRPGRGRKPAFFPSTPDSSPGT